MNYDYWDKYLSKVILCGRIKLKVKKDGVLKGDCMKSFIKKCLQAVLFTIIVIIVLFTVGYGINFVFGIEIFSIPKNENINFSGVINLILLFVSILMSNGIFQSDNMQNQILKILNDNSDVVVEIDKNMILVPMYEFKKKGTQLDVRQAEINHISTIYHFDFLTYNRTLSEATIKEVKMVIGKNGVGKTFIAKSIAEKCETGYKDGEPFKHFMVLKGICVEHKLTFEAVERNNNILIGNYNVDMNNIRFIIEYNTNGETEFIEKDVELDISMEDIKGIKNIKKEDLASSIVGNDRTIFNKECLSQFGDYHCIKGLNQNFKLK